jgi:hypothetical protein
VSKNRKSDSASTRLASVASAGSAAAGRLLRPGKFAKLLSLEAIAKTLTAQCCGNQCTKAFTVAALEEDRKPLCG